MNIKQIAKFKGLTRLAAKQLKQSYNRPISMYPDARAAGYYAGKNNKLLKGRKR